MRLLFRIALSRFGFAITLALFVLPRASFADPVLPLNTGWEQCLASVPGSGPSLCENPRGDHWRPVRSKRLYSRIGEPTERWLRVVVPETPACAQPALYFGVINLSFLTLLDGREIYRFGDPDAGPDGFAGRPYHLISLPRETGPRPGGGRTLTLRIWSNFRNVGIDGGPPLLGCRADLQRRIVLEDMPRFIIGVLAFAAGIGSFVLFLRMQREIVYLAFALFCIVVSCYVIGNRTVRLQLFLWREPLFWYYVEHFSLYCLLASFAFFYRTIAVDSRSALYMALVLGWIACGFILTNLFLLPAYRTFGAYLYTILILSAVYLYSFPRAWRQGPPEVRIFILAIVLFFSPGLGDILWALGIMPWWPGQMAPYGFVLLLTLMGVAVWRRYVRIQGDLTLAHEQLREHARNLEEDVAARTENLRNSLREIRELKEQQDGDYLLISRVIGPMAGAELGGERFRVNSFLRQYKRFQFQSMGGELGGDLCLAERIDLAGETYIAVLNADAMGKSVQGASGAIVLGVALRGYLHMTADGQIPLTVRAPVEWILRATEELQRVFLPFDGRMMVSMIFGLVHEASGKLYCINAGHPEPVLLRAGIAAYVLPPTLDKIGALRLDLPEAETHRTPPVYIPETAVAELQLLPGDVFLAGSDGRDDLRVADVGDRTRIDSDPRRFLCIVESSVDGDLDRLVRELDRAGSLIDDLSLLRIQYD